MAEFPGIAAANVTGKARRSLQASEAARLSLQTGALMMIRYFFDIRDDRELYPDEEGMEFSTQREAEMEAAHTLAGLARDLAGQEERPDVAIEVRTESGRVFQAALTFEANKARQ